MTSPRSHIFTTFLVITCCIWATLSITQPTQGLVTSIQPENNPTTPVIAEETAQTSAFQSNQPQLNTSQEPQNRPKSPVLYQPSDLPSLQPSVPLHTVSVSPSEVIEAVTSPEPVRLVITYSIEAPGNPISGQFEGVGLSVGEATRQIAAQRGFNFAYQESDMGWFITELAGVKQDPRKGYYWLFYVNGKLANQGADQITLREGDVLTWKYEHLNL